MEYKHCKNDKEKLEEIHKMLVENEYDEYNEDDFYEDD